MNWWYYEIFYVGKVSQMDVNFKILGSLSSSFFCLLTKRVVSALELNQQENSFPNRKVYSCKQWKSMSRKWENVKLYSNLSNSFISKLNLKKMSSSLSVYSPKLNLTHFSPVSHFCTPWKPQTTKGFLTFFKGYRNVTLD